MPNKALADAQRALYGLRLPGLYTSPVTSHWIWAAQGRAYSLVRQPSVAEANPEVTDSHRLSTDLRASIWHNTSFLERDLESSFHVHHRGSPSACLPYV